MAAYQRIKLGDVAHIKTGKRNNQDKKPFGKYPFFVRSSTIEKIDTYSFDGEAILMPGEGNIGDIIHYIDGKFDFHQRVYKISNFIDGIYGKYVFYALQKSFKTWALKNTVKATVDSLRLPTFQGFEFLAPDFQQQKQIVRMLEAVNAHISNLEKLISKQESIKKSTEKMLLTPKADWQQVRLGDIVDYYKGCGLSKEKLSSNGNYPCILYGELFTKYNEIIDEAQSKTFINEGFSSCYDDILLPGSTTTCGEDLIKASAILQDDVLLGGDIIVLRPNKRLVCGRFLAYLISQYKKDMLKYTQGITIIHLQGHKMMDLQIKIPNLVVQLDIVNNIIKIDEHLKQLRYSLDKLCNIKTGMMSYFFG